MEKTEEPQDKVGPSKVSMDWFHWQFEMALKEAIRVHGIEATGFAWTASQSLRSYMPRGYAKLCTEEASSIGGGDV